VPFDAKLEKEKGDTKCPGRCTALYKPPAVPAFDEDDTGAVDKTACQQNDGVGRPDRKIGLLCARIETDLVPVAGIDPGQEQGAEKQYLRCKEEPHPGNRRLGLVSRAGVLEFMT
jgi:hypothetical protein